MVSKLPAEILYEVIVQVFVDYVDEYIMERQQPASPDEQNALVCLLQTSTQLRAITKKVVCKGMGIAVDSRGRFEKPPQAGLEYLRKHRQEILEETIANLHDIRLRPPDFFDRHNAPLLTAYAILIMTRHDLAACQALIHRVLEVEQYRSRTHVQVYRDSTLYILRRTSDIMSSIWTGWQDVREWPPQISSNYTTKVVPRAQKLKDSDDEFSRVSGYWLRCKEYVLALSHHNNLQDNPEYQNMFKDVLGMAEFLTTLTCPDPHEPLTMRLRLSLIEIALSAMRQMIELKKEDEPAFDLYEQLKDAESRAREIWNLKLGSLAHHGLHATIRTH
ncbi:hypothetical protein BC629DRAFT_1596207 [Irpex lacteus]|nr:hypothetical protein BC629DRAFT_1596207 [Irpex lacteus]